jgi:hypothetical protein
MLKSAGHANVIEEEAMGFSRFLSASALLLLVLGSSLMTDDTPKALFDFTEADAAKKWQTINDGVMGGPFKLEIEWIKVVRKGAAK